MNSVGRRSFIKTAAGLGGLAVAGSRVLAAEINLESGASSVAGLRTSPLETVRIGVIGVGARGTPIMNILSNLEGTQIRAICDINADKANKIKARLGKRYAKEDKPAPEVYTEGPRDYLRMLERDDLDMVVIATPWELHTPMAIAAMKTGKHAFIEVPAAVTIEECWQLVDTAERTQLHCMMMENCCYGRDELMVLNMCRQGVFGELTYAEGAYIHNLRGEMGQIERGTGSWRTQHWIKRNGNLYPTHGLGPIAQYMNINRGDRFDHLVSMSSPSLSRAKHAREKWPADHIRNQVDYACADMNVALIKTARGRVIGLKYDTATPRPYSRVNLIQGTDGIFRTWPRPSRVAIKKYGNTHRWQDVEKCYEEFEHPLRKQIGNKGGHGGADYIMCYRIVQCLRAGLPLDQDVYDAAAWSAISELTEKSVAHRSASVDFPDFTRGKWKTMKPLGIVEA